MGEADGTGNGASPYRTSFEKLFLKQTEEFYKRESETLLVENDCPTFLFKVRQSQFARRRVAGLVNLTSTLQINRRLEEEALRAQSYLAASTEPLLITLLERVLITTHLSAILDHPASGLATLISDSRIPDLRLLYDLFGRVATGHAELQNGVSKWIVDVGKKVNDGLIEVAAKGVKEEEEEATAAAGPEASTSKAPAPARPAGAAEAKTKAALGWVQNVLDLKDQFDAILEKAFGADKTFEKSINDVSLLQPREIASEIGLTSVLAGLLRLCQRQPQVTRVHLVVHR